MGVVPQPKTEAMPILLVWEEEAQPYVHIRRARRMARRRYVIRRHPSLQLMQTRLRDLHTRVRTEASHVRRAYKGACREAWRNDARVQEHRNQYRRLRRRATRLQRTFDTRLEALLYPQT